MRITYQERLLLKAINSQPWIIPAKATDETHKVFSLLIDKSLVFSKKLVLKGVPNIIYKVTVKGEHFLQQKESVRCRVLLRTTRERTSSALAE